MRVAILLSRASQAQHYVGIARAAQAKGHRVWTVLDTRLTGGPKDDQTPRQEILPPEFPRAVIETPAPVTSLSNLKADAILWTYAPGVTATKIRALTTAKLCHLQASFSDLIGLRASLADYDAIFGWSDNWISWWDDFCRVMWIPGGRRDLVEHLRRIFVSVGPPIRDLLPVRDESAAARLVYLPFPASTLGWHWWSHGCYAGRLPATLGLGERRLVRALRGYADRLGMRFIVKSRRKTPVPAWMERLADEVVYDDPETEPVLLKLLAAGGALLVHHLSTSVVEAALAEVPALCLAPPPWRVHPGYRWRLRHRDFSADSSRDLSATRAGRSFYDFGTVLMSVDPGMAVEIFRRAKDRPQTSAAEWRAYREKFFGEHDRLAGDLIVEHLEAICK